MNQITNPEMLRLARHLRGFTQQDVATAAGIPQSSLSKYENGSLIPEIDVLETLASVLNVSVSLLTRNDRTYGLGSNGLYHRQRRSVPAGQLDRMDALVNMLRMSVDRLLESVEIVAPIQFPQFDPVEFGGDIERIAAFVRAAWKMPAGPVMNLVQLIEAAGGVILPVEFGTTRIDAYAQWVAPSPPVFLVNKSSPGDRLRFTLAHEIGHLVMHPAPNDEMEQQADEFASAFLMPQADIKHELRPVNLSHLAQLKLRWRVSIQAMVVRAYRLGTIDHDKYQSLFKELSKAGYRTREPNPIPIEQPKLLQQILDAHLHDLGYSANEVTELLGLSRVSEMRELYMGERPTLQLSARKVTIVPEDAFGAP